MRVATVQLGHSSVHRRAHQLLTGLVIACWQKTNWRTAARSAGNRAGPGGGGHWIDPAWYWWAKRSVYDTRGVNCWPLRSPQPLRQNLASLQLIRDSGADPADERNGGNGRAVVADLLPDRPGLADQIRRVGLKSPARHRASVQMVATRLVARSGRFPHLSGASSISTSRDLSASISNARQVMNSSDEGRVVSVHNALKNSRSSQIGACGRGSVSYRGVIHQWRCGTPLEKDSTFTVLG